MESDERYETLAVRGERRILFVTLNRPERLNALNPTMIDELGGLFECLADDQETRVVVLRGAGRAFCAGWDLKDESKDGGLTGAVDAALRLQRQFSSVILSMRRAPQPIIACIHGAAAGGGLSIALGADLRVAGESARMSCAYVRVGLGGCDAGSSYFLPRIVGASAAAELILTGDVIDAARAERLGLVSRVVPDADLESVATSLAEAITRNSPLGIRLSKECLNVSIDAASLEAVIAMEDRNQILAAQSGAFRGAMLAFNQRKGDRP